MPLCGRWRAAPVVDELVAQQVERQRGDELRRGLGQQRGGEGGGVDAEHGRGGEVEAPAAHEAEEVVEETWHAQRVERDVPGAGGRGWGWAMGRGLARVGALAQPNNAKGGSRVGCAREVDRG